VDNHPFACVMLVHTYKSSSRCESNEAFRDVASLLFADSCKRDEEDCEEKAVCPKSHQGAIQPGRVDAAAPPRRTVFQKQPACTASCSQAEPASQSTAASASIYRLQLTCLPQSYRISMVTKGAGWLLALTPALSAREDGQTPLKGTFRAHDHAQLFAV
jgi:hypothetical protein